MGDTSLKYIGFSRATTFIQSVNIMLHNYLEKTLTHAHKTQMHDINSALTKVYTADCGISLSNLTLSALLITNELFTSFHFSSVETFRTSFMLG